MRWRDGKFLPIRRQYSSSAGRADTASGFYAGGRASDDPQPVIHKIVYCDRLDFVFKTGVQTSVRQEQLRLA